MGQQLMDHIHVIVDIVHIIQYQYVGIGRGRELVAFERFSDRQIIIKVNNGVFSFQPLKYLFCRKAFSYSVGAI